MLDQANCTSRTSACSIRKRIALLITVGVYWLIELRARGQSHADYKYEVYAEDADRIQVRTQSALLEQKLSSWMAIKGSFVYDGISGATPTGGLPPPGSTRVPLAHIEDIRRAFTIEPIFTLGRHVLRPQFGYSIERDYESIAPSLNYLVDFNQHNTTLVLGVAHNFDRLTKGIFLPRSQSKESTDWLVGLTQVLSPGTLFNR